MQPQRAAALRRRYLLWGIFCAEAPPLHQGKLCSAGSFFRHYLVVPPCWGPCLCSSVAAPALCTPTAALATSQPTLHPERITVQMDGVMSEALAIDPAFWGQEEVASERSKAGQPPCTARSP